MYLVGDGEWVSSNLAFGAVFVIAGLGVVGLFWYVIRGERLNRRDDPDEAPEEALEKVTGTSEPEAHRT